MTYRDIRDGEGRLLARYDAKRDLLAIKARGRVSVVDLRQLREQADDKEPPAPSAPKA